MNYSYVIAIIIEIRLIFTIITIQMPLALKHLRNPKVIVLL